MPPNMTSYDNQAMPNTYDNNMNNNPTVTQDDGLISVAYIKSIPGIIKLAEMTTCIICLICSIVWETNQPLTGGGWVTFVAMTSLVFVILVFIVSIFRIHDKIVHSFALCITVEFFIYVGITVSYLVSAIVAAAYGKNHSSIAACCFFCFVATAAFGADTFFGFKTYRNRPQGGAKKQTTNDTATEAGGPGPAY